MCVSGEAGVTASDQRLRPGRSGVLRWWHLAHLVRSWSQACWPSACQGQFLVKIYRCLHALLSFILLFTGFPRVLESSAKSWKMKKEKSGPERSWNWALVLKKCWYLITVVLSGAEKSVQHASCPMKQILLLNFPFHVLMCVCFIPVCCHWCSFRLVQLLLLWTKKYCISIALLVLQCPVLPSNS